MGWKKRYLRPVKITHDCIQAAITFDRLAVIRSDHSLWMLCPFTSEMWLEIRRKRGKDISFPLPRFRRIMKGVKQVDASAMTMSVVKTDGSLWIWNHCGEQKTPAEFTKLADQIDRAETDESGLLALTKQGEILFWRRENRRYASAAEYILDDATDIAVGVGDYAAIREDHSLWTWGRNDAGQLGDGTRADKARPVKIMDDILQVSLGARHGAAVDRDHCLWMWGENTFGQLGTGKRRDELRPVPVKRDVRKVSLGDSHTGIITCDGRLWMTGFNGKYGSLGDGKTENRRRIEMVGSGAEDLTLGADRAVWVTDQRKMFICG